MPHVITQPCCGDGSCVYACPVNCIHPSPDEPGFATTEMLYIDPVACVDCGACVGACPVSAIVPDTRLTPQQAPFAAVNAAFYPPTPAGARLVPTTRLAPVLPAPRVRRGAIPLTVAVVGAGPAGMYAADELLTQSGVRVNVFDALPVPYGLVRGGVAPDHAHTKGVTRLFDRIADREGFSFYLNVAVGQHISHRELLDHHHAVIYAVGAASERPLAVDGAGLDGVVSATATVAWINGDPRSGHGVDLCGERAVIIGNGNVALDLARILTADPDALSDTDISDDALTALRRSSVREVVIAARRGPAESAFTLPELIGLTGAAPVVIGPDDRALVDRDLESATDPSVRAKLEILSGLADPDPARRQIRLAYRLTPRRFLAGPAGAVARAEFTRTGTGETVTLDTGVVLTSIGYRGRPVAGLPFDETSGVLPSAAGRVLDPATGSPVAGSYVAGWIKRGPTGFIGTNKSCAMQTVAALVEDYNAGLLTEPVHRRGLHRLLLSRRPDLVDSAGWKAIDAAEISLGEALGRPRVKFTSVEDMLAAAGTSARPTPWREMPRRAARALRTARR